jgi:hypothetical protein
VPPLLIDKLLKVATPFIAATGEVPLSVPLLGLVAIARPTKAVLVVTKLLKASCTCTVTAGEIVTPAAVFEGCCPKASLLAMPGFTVKGLLIPVIPLLPVAVAVSVKVPVFVIVTLWLVKTPFKNGPELKEPPSIVPFEDNITLSFEPVKPVSVLLLVSFAVIEMLKAVPATCGLLIVEKTKCVTVPGFTVKLLLVAFVRVPSEAVNVNDKPAAVGTRFENVATPADAATVVVESPLNAPPVLIAMVTLEVSVVTRFPPASCTCTTTAGAIAWPAVVVEGCWVKTSLLAAPAVMLKAVLTAEVSPVLVAVSV